MTRCVSGWCLRHDFASSWFHALLWEQGKPWGGWKWRAKWRPEEGWGEKGSWDAHSPQTGKLLHRLQGWWKTCPTSIVYSSTKRNGKQIGTFEEAMLEESWQNLRGLQMASTSDSLSPATDGCFTADSGRSSSTESLGSACAGPHPLWQPHILSGLQWSPLLLLAARCTFWNAIPAPHCITLQYIGKQPLHRSPLLNQEILLLAERELQHHYYSSHPVCFGKSLPCYALCATDDLFFV